MVPLLDGAIAAALRRFLAAGVPAARIHEPAAGVSSVVAEVMEASQIAAVELRPDIVTQQVFHILSSVVGGVPVTDDTLLAPLGLSSMQITTLRDNLFEALAAESEDIPLVQLLEWVTADDATAGGLASNISSLLAIQQAEVTAELTGSDVQIRMQLQLDELTVQLAELAFQSEFAPLSPKPLPVPLYLALEAVLIVALQLADALPLCAALLGASFVAHHTSALIGQMLLPLCLVLAALLNMLVTVALKWVVLGRMRPGEHPLHGWWHLCYWFVESRLHCHDLLLRHFLVGTPLFNAWLRLLGAHVGVGASVNTLSVGAALDLLTIGAGANVGDCSISCHHVPRSGVMVIASVVVGARATIGPMSILMPGANVGDSTVVGACSVVERAIPPHTFWAGRPLQQVPTDPLEGVTFVRPAAEQEEATPGCTVGQSAALSEVLPRRGINVVSAKLAALRPLLSLVLAAWFGAASVNGLVFGVLLYFPRPWLTTFGWNSWGVALIFCVSYAWVWPCGMILLGVLLKWLLVGRLKPGMHVHRYPLLKAACNTYYSIIADVLGAQPLVLSPPMLANLYLRLCGAYLGRRVFVFCPLLRATSADLLRLSDASFLQKQTKLVLQLPVRCALRSGLVQTSVFNLGKVHLSPFSFDM